MLSLFKPAPSLLARYLAMSAYTAGPVERSIRAKLTDQLRPIELSIRNDSSQHRHHAAMAAAGGSNGETHFFLHIVSDAFVGKSTMQRHRLVYAALAEELAQGLHSLSMKTQTLSEVQKFETSK